MRAPRAQIHAQYHPKLDAPNSTFAKRLGCLPVLTQGLGANGKDQDSRENQNLGHHNVDVTGEASGAANKSQFMELARSTLKTLYSFHSLLLKTSLFTIVALDSQRRRPKWNGFTIMWLKQYHQPSPSHHHFYRWYG